MTAARSLVLVPPSASVVPESAGRGRAECQSATTYIGGTGTGTRPGRGAIDHARPAHGSDTRLAECTPIAELKLANKRPGQRGIIAGHVVGPPPRHPDRACYQRARRAERASPKVCRLCGSVYVGRAWRYCSGACRLAAKNTARSLTRRKRQAVCPTCGRSFAAQWGQRFCSLACRPPRGRKVNP